MGPNPQSKKLKGTDGCRVEFKMVIVCEMHSSWKEREIGYVELLKMLYGNLCACRGNRRRLVPYYGSE